MRKLLLTITAIISVILLTACPNDLNDKDPIPTDFAFELTWGTYGISSYDSATGKLVKTTDATVPENYITKLILKGAEISEIYELITELDMDSYPENYNPNPDVFMEPSQTLILKVTENGTEKIIKSIDICDMTHYADEQGKKFLQTCREIANILMSSEEWKALPDYEVLYE